MTLRKQINDAVKEIRTSPRIRRHVENTLKEWKIAREQMSAEQGLKGSYEAKQRIYSKLKLGEEDLNENIDYIIKTEKDALHAMNLHRLLTKQWIEYPNSYRICS